MEILKISNPPRLISGLLEEKNKVNPSGARKG
jgi:hypothetical protein